jgi:hypothetical protein
MDKPSASSLGVLGNDAVVAPEPGVSGLLWVHLLAGRGLRTTTSSSAATTPSTPSGPPIGKQFIANVRESIATCLFQKALKALAVGLVHFSVLKHDSVSQGSEA